MTFGMIGPITISALGRIVLSEKEFDSAYLMFQFINYAFKKEKDGYYVYMGSNRDGTSL
jgi:hypothetical protein